ncbi:nitroreductase [Mucilaginibacter yixingensis]|uniref:Nitroreductase n=1 Tax=Mucilaginibacter yixingensis TaxID=1295612 RepID=A0A2T5JD77_9SPHI|nr:NAD(P)H-dependent oxidoreductase [Mucilaginibacter yixingensis]PTQ99722.1 nitroreductase [Mucilaginibacter yixingensis]
MSLIEKLQWRSAIKNFDNTQKVSPEKINELLDAVQLSPSSAGLQPYRVLVVEDAETRAKLLGHAYNQAQITDASAVIVFAAETQVDADLVKKYIDLIASVRQIDRSTLEGFENVINGGINSRTAEENITWAHKQAYIALGVLLTAAADLQIDACPMEGFSPAAFDEVLGLKEKGLTTSVIAAVGYRADADVYSKVAKVRKPVEDFLIHI